MPPTPHSRHDATRRIADAGKASAERAGLVCHLEHSPSSESLYLHTKRGAHWYGVRVSCHEAVYDCCTDYEQLMVDDPPLPDAVEAACAEAARLVLAGGRLVADPAEVAVAIEKIALVMADGRVWRDDDDLRWRWSSDDERWNLACRYDGEDEPAPPSHRPVAAVSSRIRCQVRHSHNVNAKWAAESEG